MFLEFIFSLFILYALWNIFKKPSNYPPGPWGLPLIGYLPFGMKHFRAKLKELEEKHYPVFSWRIGPHLVVFVCDYKMVKEAFQSQVFAERPKMIFFSSTEDQNTGLTISNGIHWHNIRKFTVRHLKDLGLGKSKIVSAVQHEANELVKVMKKASGKTAPIPEEISTAIINVLWQMIAGKRYEFHDETAVSFEREMHRLQSELGRIVIHDLFPWLDFILPDSLIEIITRKSIHSKFSENFLKRFEKDVIEHELTLDENNPRDFIDEYLIEMEKRKEDPDNTMSRKDLLACIGDLFGAGLDTTSTTLHWSIFYLAKYQEIQKELQKEIDNVLPNGICPTYEDKSKMPKMEAFITEILRITSLVEFGVPRAVSSDTKLGGYDIPKGSVIIGAEKIIHFDKRNYDSPERFNPKRFLDLDGKFAAPKEGFLPFGIGKRQCIGESLAKMDIFIFLVTMLQHVEFHPPVNKEVNLTPQDIPIFNVPHFRQNILIKARS